MKVIGYRRSLPVDHAEALIDIALPKPAPQGRDLLVAVRAVSVNPVDFKVRLRAEPANGEVKVLGYDASGVVEAVGPDCTMFQPGDEVWYAGDIRRPGTNAEFHLVDERIVGRKPKSIGFAAAAALPLTTITAWELLFDRLQVDRQHEAALLVIGGAGGVGSVLIQLARRLTRLTIIATASRSESRDWCRELGAHHVVDHTGDLAAQVTALVGPPIRYVAGLTHSDLHWPVITGLVAPQGKVALIDDPGPIDVRLLKQKSVSLHWELMFTRSMFETPDIGEQGRLLGEAAAMVDRGELRSTVNQSMGAVNAANLKQAHALLESGRAIGKITLEGF